MTWTYTGNPDTDAKQVRLLIGDTNAQDKLLNDTEISFVLGLTSDIFAAAADCCDIIIAKLARDVDRNDIGMSATRSQQIQHYTDLRESLRNRAESNAEPYAGAQSKDEKLSDRQDTDLPQPQFRLGMNTNTRSR